jgi:peptidoglycan/LPS O-acetylase OafA/YrhL
VVKFTERPFDPLLFLRGLAAVSVVLYHSIPAARDFKGSEWTWWMLPSGSLWVYVFFLLSGYLIGKSFWTGKYEFTKEGILKFYERRALRILPLYYLSVVGVGLLGWPGIFLEENRKVLMDVLTLRYSIIEPLSPFDNSFWSISTEVQFYLFAPLICWLFLRGLRNSTVAATLFSFVVAGLWFFKSRTFHYRFDVVGYDQQVFVEEFYTPLLMNLDIFLAGVFLNWGVNDLTAWLKPRGTDVAALGKIRWIGGIVLLNVYLVSTRIEFDFLRMKTMVNTFPWIVWQPMFVIAGVGLFILIMESTNTLSSSGPIRLFPFGSKLIPQAVDAVFHVFLRLGEHAGQYGYGIYLWHGVSIQWSEKIFGNISDPLLRFVVIAVVAVFFAYAVGSTLERFLRRILKG